MAITTRKQAIMATNKDVTLGNALTRFYGTKRAENLSPNTLSTYKIHIDYFMETLGNPIDAECKYLGVEDWLFFVSRLKNDPKKNERSVASYCRSVKAFLNWLMDNDYTDYFKMSVPKAQRVIKQTYTDEELKILLARTYGDLRTSYSSFQTWVFINFAIATGLRLSSMLEIQVKDYSPTEKSVFIQHAKNNFAQTRYLNGDMCDMLNEYIKKFELTDNDYLFCVSGGQQMSRRAMEDNVERYNHARGIKKKSIHLFRHTFARKFLESGGTVIDLQRLLDHSDINTTMQYVRDYSIDIKKTTEVFNPQEKYTNEKKKKSQNRKKTLE